MFSVASGDRQVHFGSRGYCGRHDARANSLRAGLQPFAWRSGIGVTRSAPAEERAHIVLRALSQNSTSVLESMNAASTTHLLLWHSAVVTPAVSAIHTASYQRTGDLRAVNERPAGPVNGRTWLAFDREISPGDSTRRATLTIASSTLRAQQALAGEPGRG